MPAKLIESTPADPSTTETTSESAPPGLETAFDTVSGIWKDFLAHLPLIGAGVLVLVGTAVIAKLFDAVSRRLLAKTRLRESLQALLERILYITIWAIGLIVSAMVVLPGLTPTKALAGLGLSSIAIGFAFKDIFENFFAGILILWRFPFEVHDFIECDSIRGRVEDITVRNTLIRRTSGELVVVPNATIFKNPVDVLTNRNVRRVTILCGVAYGEDIDEARSVIESALDKCESVDTSQPVQVFAHEFGSSSIDFELAWWTDPTPLGYRRSRDEVITQVKRALDDAGIEIPFPYRTLTFKEPLSIGRQRPDDDGSEDA